MTDDIENIEDTLNDRQIRFAQEYIIDLNGTQAYKRAGYDVKDDEIAKVNASRLLTNANVKKLIHRMKAERARRSQITADRVLAQLDRLAFSDLRDIYGEERGLLPIPQLGDDAAAAIQSVKLSDRKMPGSGSGEDAEYETIIEYKFADKKGSLDLLAKHLGLVTEKVELDISDNMMERMELARARSAKVKSVESSTE